MSKFFLKNPLPLSAKINRAIGYRISICFLLAITILVALTLTEIKSSSAQLKKSLNQECSGLQSFIISQFMMDNKSGIQAKLDSLNQASNGAHLSWSEKIKDIKAEKMVWDFSLSWSYFYPIKGLDGTKLGTLIVTGNLLDDHDIVSHLLTRIGLLLLFFISILIVLYPLSKRIPQQLFITPINNLLSLLREGNSSGINDENSSKLPTELTEIHHKITALLEDEKNRSKQTALGQLATQVAHDIRSPLLVLTRILSDLSSLPEKKRVDVRHAISRVTDIANNLLTQYNELKKILTTEPIGMMLESIISEKRIQITDLGIEIELSMPLDMHNTFVETDSSSFKRVVSNLINNSIEAIKNKNGKISISAHKENKKVFVMIKDNGCGIPKEKLRLVFEGGSFDKKEGSGLGLPYAAKKINEWNGEYSIQSEINTGTSFEIVLPEARAAEWFANEIQLTYGDRVVVLDDDDYIHQIWKKRFSEDFLKKNNISLFHFSTSQDFIQFCGTNDIEKMIFLLDYEIGQEEKTGLDLASLLKIGKQSTLVTSRYEDNEIRENCKKLGMKIIPKYFSEHIPISMSDSDTAYAEIVFIDDDKIITDIWKMSASDAGKNIHVFQNPNDFMKIIECYSKNTLIYIDSFFGDDNPKGEDFAKIFYEKGYKNIILATGYPKELFKHVTWVKDVIEKNPPWG